uniref:ANK_REP_REGION domain-containing protein n=1 Tax=Meloidogyne incognita TaxID=6306 RepID=A0A914MPY3_MELIC
MPLMINHTVSMNSLSNQSNIYSQPQQYQNPVNSMMQMSNNNNNNQYQQPNKHYRPHPYLPQHSSQQHSSTLPRNNGNCWTTATTTTALIGENKNLLTTSSTQNLNSSSIHYGQQQPQLLIGATGNVNGIAAALPLPNNNANIYNNQQQQQQNIATTSTIVNNNNNSSTSYSRCSSSGIGGSSTEHSPLGQLLPLHCSSANIVVDPSFVIVGNNNENEEQRQIGKLIKELQDFLMFKRRALLDCNSEIISKLRTCIVNSTNERGRTFLHLLFQNMFLMTANDNEADLLANIDLLFKSGVSIDAQDADGTTALSLAVRNRKFRAVKLMVDRGADANLPDLDNKSPLYHICANLSTEEDLEIAEFLINGVADLKLDTLARETETPLIRCAALCNPFSLRIAELIISRVEASQRIEFVNYSGKTLTTALHRAASVGNEPMVRLLIRHGANKESTDKEGKSPLFVAVEQAQYETVSVLLELGADRNKSDMNDTKIMELASQPGFEPISQLFRKFPENQNNHQHLQFFNSSTRSSSTPKDQQKNQNNGKRQRVGTKRRNTATTTTNNSSSNSILQVIQRGVNSVLLPSNNREINNYEDGSSAAKKRAPIIISTNNNTNISPPCLAPYYPPSSNNICQQSLNNSNILQNQQQQQIPSSPPLLPSIQQNQFNEEDRIVESSSSSIYSNIRTSSFPTATNTINNTILNNYNNNEGISTTTFNVPLVSHKEPLKKFMDVYLGYTPI